MLRQWWGKLLLAVVMLAAAALPQAPLAYADVEVCDSEPPVLVWTPAGNPVLVNNFLTVPFKNRGALHKANVSGVAERGSEPGTSRITITVWVPGLGKNKHETDSNFEVKVRSVVQRAERYSAEAVGPAGTPIRVNLVVPIP